MVCESILKNRWLSFNQYNIGNGIKTLFDNPEEKIVESLKELSPSQTFTVMEIDAVYVSVSGQKVASEGYDCTIVYGLDIAELHTKSFGRDAVVQLVTG
ncbi:hypothetical protein CI610_00237 [invertebrate metagenome]|uniref:Uncharacterized protein n=1 Tax=invertebrate metagenome TaxID=1711999 RepID=A0A2H9TC33_9ZZZZ